MFRREGGRAEARGMRGQLQGVRLRFLSPGAPIEQLQPGIYIMRIELKEGQHCTYPLKLATHEQNARPHTLLRAVEMALSITEENFGDTEDCTKESVASSCDCFVRMLRSKMQEY